MRAAGAWDPFASATWGIYSVNDELHGRLQGRVATAGFSLGGGVRRRRVCDCGIRMALGHGRR